MNVYKSVRIAGRVIHAPIPNGRDILRLRPAARKVAIRPGIRRDRISLAYEQLREMIVRGRLAPGSRVVEIDVAERLGISRTPVRSALQRLQQEGYILAAGGGKQVRLSVAPLTIEDARELFDVVGAVEALAARGAAELESEPRRAVVAELERINDALLHAAARPQPDRNELFELDTAYHRCYVEAGAGVRTLALHDAVKPQAERYIRLYINALADEIGRSVHEHAVILAGIESGDGDAAQSAVRTNWRNASDRLSHVIATLGERGSW